MQKYDKQSYDMVAKLIRQERQYNDKDFKINGSVAKIIIDDLKKRGEFYHNEYVAYFFSEEDKKLIPIEPDSNEFALLLARYDINRIERLYKYLVQSLWTEAITNGAEITVYRLSYYDADRFILYLYDHKNQVYRISPEKVEIVDNGTDGILFISDPETQPFENTEIEDYSFWLNEVLLSKMNPASTILETDEARLAVRMWFYSLFFKEIMTTKMILLFLGPKGSGKTMIAQKIGMILFGDKFNVTPLTKDSKDFDAAITNSSYVAVDNADTAPRWFEDKLAVVATGGTIKKRLYFTTNEEVAFPIQCFAAITSRTPNFQRDDVADRLLIVELKRYERFLRANSLLSEVLKHRHEIMSEIVYELQKIVRALRDLKDEDMAGSFRMADFADFCMKIGCSEGIESQIRTLLHKLEYLQRGFALERHSTGKLVYLLAQKKPGVEWDARGLNEELVRLAEEEKIFFPYARKINSFAQHLTKLKSSLAGVVEIASRSGHGGSNRYMIRPKWAQSQSEKDGGNGGG